MPTSFNVYVSRSIYSSTVPSTIGCKRPSYHPVLSFSYRTSCSPIFICTIQYVLVGDPVYPINCNTTFPVLLRAISASSSSMFHVHITLTRHTFAFRKHCFILESTLLVSKCLSLAKLSLLVLSCSLQAFAFIYLFFYICPRSRTSQYYMFIYIYVYLYNV